ncbi:MAG: glycosyltransferase family 4 protein [Chitinophaga sp.]|uniref:glycosyltransferase family 4 protein n=1 Tax=Chitinophaga sp. TaxID=1869181 RepID=UPI001B2C8D8D|nr:glycosyltransferase family 1 protein [Chitinophaga sp.]MBO9732229.1 glycosyltransferase family 4 protein [Chitinophaga sp.]
MQLFLDNLVFSIQRSGGVSVYWYELITGICKSDLSVSFLNARRSSANIFEQRIDYSGFDCIRESWIPDKYLRYLPVRYPIPSGAIFHGGYLRVAPRKDVLNILTVHDFAHERKLATAFPRAWANVRQKAYGIKQADGIICISENTRKDLLHFYPDTDPDRIRIIHHGIADDFYPIWKRPAVQDTLPLSPDIKYILYVGARRNYKNFWVVMEVMRQLPEDYHLVIVGGEKWTDKEMRGFFSGQQDRYHIFQTVSAATLNLLYNHAFCLLYPSAYEGFGFPPGEAMKAGCPVVAANMSSVPEVTGQVGLLADTIDAGAFLEKIRLLETAHYREEVITSGLEQAKKFTWDSSVAATIRFYKDCWDHKFSR